MHLCFFSSSVIHFKICLWRVLKNECCPICQPFFMGSEFYVMCRRSDSQSYCWGPTALTFIQRLGELTNIRAFTECVLFLLTAVSSPPPLISRSALVWPWHSFMRVALGNRIPSGRKAGKSRFSSAFEQPLAGAS